MLEVELDEPASEDKLYGNKPGVDPDYDLIMEESLAKNEYPAAKLEQARAAAHTCLAAKMCTKEVWDKYSKTVSSGKAKWTLARAINSGVMYPSSFVGCHAGDRESYDDFSDFFYPVIEAYHKGFSMSVGTQLQGTASERMDASRIRVKLTETAQTKIISTRIRVARNLAMFPLNPGGSRESREEIATLMSKVYAGLAGTDLAGDFFLHTKMSDEQRQVLVDGHWLFRGKDKMQAASGYHEHWPHGRGVFLNHEKTFVNWVNEGDHLRIISMQEGGDVAAVFARLSAGAKAIEEGVRRETGQTSGEVFMMHPKFGSVTCCPSNLGTGMRGSVHILVPKLIASIGFEAIDKLARERNCQARGSSGEHSEVVDRIDISNWRRIGLPEYELVEDMINCANFLAAEEDKLRRV
jgi:protein-arginine kinase